MALGMVMGLLAAAISTSTPAALAADLDNGENVFSANCAACHAGSNNTVDAEKKLTKDALQKFGKYDIPQIVKQVTKGNGAMPSFGERIAPEDVDDVAAY